MMAQQESVEGPLKIEEVQFEYKREVRLGM
jgi:hypothetical protein